ncbi:hypothetical protein GOODEAATRI_031341 [Goodea atripinnis]|uniref:Uncharacterized protein n=1 Tax=Goodea atripinnis TaxID=208336 RepID=A0ABV0NZN0_9TELE
MLPSTQLPYTPESTTQDSCSTESRNLLFLLSVEVDAFSLSPAPLPYLPCFSSVSCLFLEPLFAYLPNSSKIWIWSAGLSMQLIKFSRREDRGRESPLARTGHFSPDTRWTPGRSGGLCVCR